MVLICTGVGDHSDHNYGNNNSNNTNTSIAPKSLDTEYRSQGAREPGSQGRKVRVKGLRMTATFCYVSN